MKKRKFIVPVLFWGMAIVLGACGAKEGSTDIEPEDGNRMELTREEMESGHASFQIDENLMVDADVTEKEKYEDGLASYYLQVIYETEEDDEEVFRKNPTVAHHSFQEWEGLLNKVVQGKFKDKKFMLDSGEHGLQQKYIGENGSTYIFNASWAGIVRGLDRKTPFNTLALAFRMEEGGVGSNMYANIEKYVSDYAKTEVTFLQDADEVANKLRAFFEEMSGRKIYDRYELIPVNKANVDALREKEEWMVDEIEEEYAVFDFYYEIDGLPFWNMYLTYNLKNNETASELCYWGTLGAKSLTGMSEHTQEVIVGENGIMEMSYSDMRKAGEIYREQSPVVSPNEALKQVKDYYDRKFLTEPCLISDIALVYTGYFSDGSKGEIQPTIAPFWVVTVYDNSHLGSVWFVYDAYTGDCIEEGATR